MSKPHLSDAEWAVMDALWQRAPATARDVLEATPPERAWAYTTVKTLLDRLMAKGAVHARKRANVLVYEPRIERGDARRHALRGLVDRAFGGTLGSLVHHLVAAETLSAAERDELRRLLADHDARGADRDAREGGQDVPEAEHGGREGGPGPEAGP
jgi:predicted transcriptional regulator